MKKPVVEYADCNLCLGCIAVAPSVFVCNDAGFIHVADAEPGCCYPEDAVDEAIAMCPKDCIRWEEEKSL
ncbi:MAG: ferredoxin [Desulfococcaceae bacterium]|jgi:ferredoxin|nr:ferredoxin [Desulfococcaceae bacterium]